MPVQSLDIVQVRLNRLHGADGLAWRTIAARPEYVGIPPGTLSAIAGGRDPKKEEHRRILGLPVPVKPRRCLARRKCDGKTFTPNVPWRWSCYECSPPKVRKK